MAFSARARLVLALVATVAAAPAGAGPDVNFELSRFFGRWYVIARAPPPDPPVSSAYFEYRPLDDGHIDALYVARPEPPGTEPVAVHETAAVDPEHPARWQILGGWLDWLFGDERWLLYVSADYRYALAGTPARGEGWILAREPVIPEWAYAGLLARLALEGYDVSRFRRVPQTPGEVGP